MKKTTFTKKIKLYPLGDKEEINRVYEYIRNGQYSQYLALNRLMSEIATLYYHCNRDFKSDEFISGSKEIYKSANPIFDDVEFPTGADLKSQIIRKVQSDFSTALKNGLAKGERTIPTYKRNSPMLITGRSLSVKKEEGENGKDEYIINWVNKIQFKVVLGPSGRNNAYLMSLMETLADQKDNCKICGSQIEVDGKYIYLYLVVQKEVEEEQYTPVTGRVLGVSLGYDKPLVCALNDSDKVFEIGIASNFIEKRITMQNQYRKLQTVLKECRGGKGRKHKLAALNRYKDKEKNFVKTYNHLLSKQIVELAKNLNVEMIVIESIKKEDLIDYPALLRNWSYYQLTEYTSYKAKAIGIKVLESKSKEFDKSCCGCGCIFEKKDVLPKDIVWSNNISFTCPECGEVHDYSENKAKNIAVLG